MAQLQPQQVPIGILPQFAVPQPTCLVIKEKMLSFSGDDFSIKDQNGVVVCKVDGRALSLRGQKDFLDASGTPLFSVKKQLLSLHGSNDIVGPDGTNLCEVKGKFSFMRSKAVAHFRNAADGRQLSIEVKGDWIEKHATMTLLETGAIVAILSRQVLNLREIFSDSQTYFVEVAPGVDLVLVAALAVIFDERNHEN